MIEAESKPVKLPRVWVAIDPDGVAWAGTDKGLAPSATEDLTIARYAPVQRPRVCEWKIRSVFLTTGCGKVVSRSAYPYCHHCGGKIKEKR